MTINSGNGVTLPDRLEHLRLRPFVFLLISGTFALQGMGARFVVANGLRRSIMMLG